MLAELEGAGRVAGAEAASWVRGKMRERLVQKQQAGAEWEEAGEGASVTGEGVSTGLG